jgi:hypothetical protein
MDSCGWEHELWNLRFALSLLLLMLVTTPSHTQNDSDFDAYKIRISSFWFLLKPFGRHPGQQ